MKGMKKTNKNVRIIMPAKNEEKNLRILLPKLKDFKVTIVDDNSSDNTSKIAKKYNASIIRNEQSMGPSLSIEKALKTTKESIIILMDSDNEHNPEDIPKFLKSLKKNDAVFGRREIIPRISEKMLSKFSSKKGIHDLFCGFVCFKKEVYERIGYFEKENTFGAEFKLNCVKYDFKISEIKIKSRRRKNPRIGNNLKANLKILKTGFRLYKKLLF